MRKNGTSVFKRKYGKTLVELAKQHGVSTTTIWQWDQRGLLANRPLDIFQRNRSLAVKLRHIFTNIVTRCTSPKDPHYKNYGGRGIKNFLTLDELELLWKRDHAERLKQPSIDRINGHESYTLSNCRFIEMEMNRKRPRFTYKGKAIR